MGLPEFAKNMRVPVNYRDHVIDSGVLAWVFYERHHHGRLKPLVSIPRRKEAKKRPAKTIDIARYIAGDRRTGMAVGGTSAAGGPLLIQHLLALLAGVVAMVVMRPTGANHRLRSS